MMLKFKFLFVFISLILLGKNSFSQNHSGCKKLPENASSISVKRTIKRSVNPLVNNYDVCFYNIDLDATNTSTAISGFVQMKAKTKVSNFNKVVLDLSSSFIIDSVKVNGVKTSSNLLNDELTINLSSPLYKDTYFETFVYYHGNGSYGQNFPAGMHNGTSNSKKYTYTVSEPFHSYLWWPCKQELDDKADSVYINITTENTNLVASNGLLKNTVDLNNGKKRFEWKTYYPIAYYLITFSTGPYIEYKTYANPKGATNPILIQTFLYDQNDLNNNKTNIDKTAAMLEFFSEKYGLYPFSKEKYGHYSAPSNLGALENQTMSMMNAYSYDLIAHELSHQWFGNNVTCGTWSDIWMNEGFAEFSECLANEFLVSKSSSLTKMKSMQTEVIGYPTSCAYVKNPLEPFEIFDHTNSYSKGATVLNMLRFNFGNDSLFFDMFKQFQTKYAGKTATTDTFALFVSNYAKKDYTYFFNQWIKGSGHPIYTFSYYQKGDTLYLTSKQSGSSSTGLFKMKLDFLVNFSIGGSQTFEVFQTKNNELFKIYIPGKSVSTITANPSSWNLLKVNGSIVYSSGENTLISFNFNPSAVSSSINGNTVNVVVPFGTNVKSLKATYKASTSASVYIGQTYQVSGVTVNDFTNPITYTVVAQNGMKQEYIVNVSVAKNTEKEVLTFNFENTNPKSIGVIKNDTIRLEVPYGSDLKTLIASFTLSQNATLTLNQQSQLSGITINDFSDTLIYSVIAENGDMKNYVVVVKKSAPVQNLGFLSYEFASISDSIIKNDSVIQIFVPSKTDLKKLIANFSVQKDAIVKIKGIVQDSGATVNDFTTEVTYEIFVLNGVSKTVKVKVQKLIGAGIEELQSGISVYPNPSSGVLKVKAEAGTILINIHDQAGKLLYKYESQNYQAEILAVELKEIETSLVIIQLVNNGIETIKKIEILK